MVRSASAGEMFQSYGVLHLRFTQLEDPDPEFCDRPGKTITNGDFLH